MFKGTPPNATALDLEAGHVDIVTDRLRLSPLTAEHRDVTVAALSDYSVASALARVPHPYRPEDFDAFAKDQEQNAKEGELRLAISDWQTGQFIGVIGLRAGEPCPEIGYWLAKDFWGRGIMKEAAGALLDHFFALSDNQVVRAGYFLDNPRSAKVLSFLGFKEVGTSKVHSLARGEDVDHRDMELTREAYFGTGPSAEGAWHRQKSRSSSYTMNY